MHFKKCKLHNTEISYDTLTNGGAITESTINSESFIKKNLTIL